MKTLFTIFFMALILTGCSNSAEPTETYDITTHSKPDNAGVVEPSEGTFEKGTRIEFKAIPGEGWKLYRWGGDLRGDENPVSTVINGFKSVTAHFERDLRSDPYTLWGMGANNSGQLGIAPSNSIKVYPVTISSDVQKVSAGEGYIHFIKTDGTLWGMGHNDVGQLGDGTTTDRHNPVQIATNVEMVTAGSSHTLFIKTGGTLWGMGGNAGQLGDGYRANRKNPIKIASDVIMAVGGDAHSLYIKTDGTLWGMGDNFHGQLGKGREGMVFYTPVQIAEDVTSVAAGINHSLFVKSDGSLWAMGANNSGQLGNGTNMEQLTPVQIASGVKSISAGPHHSFIIFNDGSLKGMGRNKDGQLGDGTFTNRNNPVPLNSEIKIAAGGKEHSLFVRHDGTLWGTGDKTFIAKSSLSNVDRINNPAYIGSGVDTVVINGFNSFFIIK